MTGGEPTMENAALRSVRPHRIRASRLARGIAFLGPAGLLIILMFFVPIVLNLLISFTDMGASLAVTKFTVANYTRMLFADTRLRDALLLSLSYSLLGVFFSVTLGLVLAIATTGIGALSGTLFRILWLLPRVAPVVVYAMLIKLAVSPSDRALINSGLIALGFEPANLIDTNAFAIVVIGAVIGGASLGMIVFTASIRAIPAHLYHAASVDGAGRWGHIRHIILPALRWQIAFISAFQMLSFLSSIELIVLVTNGGPFFDTTTYPVYAANRAFSSGQYAYGAALSTGLVVIGVGLALLAFRLQRGHQALERPRIEIG